jgi:hypothetical protein
LKGTSFQQAWPCSLIFKAGATVSQGFFLGLS